MEKVYLLMKRGLYYAPNSQGYTGLKDNAGRYPITDHAPDYGVEAIHEDDAPEFAPACYEDIKLKHVLKQREELRKCVIELLGRFDPQIHTYGQTPDWYIEAAKLAGGIKD